MSREIDSVIEQALTDAVLYPFFAVKLQFDSGDLLLWTGVGTLTVDGESYLGTGDLLSISVVEETTEIAARGATLDLTGVNPSIISYALTEDYQGRPATIFFGTLRKSDSKLLKEDGFNLLQEDGSAILLESAVEISETGLAEVFTGFMDQMIIADEATSATISLSLENRLLNLERPRVQRYTNEWLQEKYPGDLGLSHVEDIQTRSFEWGS